MSFPTAKRRKLSELLRGAASLRRLAFAPARKFRRAASRAELIRSRCHPAFCVAELFRRLAVLRQHFFELLFDAQGIGRGARPEFPQGMPIALAPSDQSLMVFSAPAEKGGDAIGELAERHRVEAIDDEGAAGPARRTWRSPRRDSSPDAGNSKWGRGVRPFWRTHKSSLSSTASSRAAYHPLATG